MEELLLRYSNSQKEIIEKYWECLSFTRKTGKISEGVKLTELRYWSKYETGIVIKALEIHMEKYPNIKEHYTRGIIRNLSTGAAAAPAPNTPTAKRKNRFENFQSRKYSEDDYKARDYLNHLAMTGELQEKREELKKDPRYAKFLR